MIFVFSAILYLGLLAIVTFIGVHGYHSLMNSIYDDGYVSKPKQIDFIQTFCVLLFGSFVFALSLAA